MEIDHTECFLIICKHFEWPYFSKGIVVLNPWHESSINGSLQHFERQMGIMGQKKIFCGSTNNG